MAVKHPGRLGRRHFLGATIAGATLSGAQAQTAVLDAPCGPLRGITVQAGLQSFLGIPYAEPPVGPLRYASPRPAPRWNAVRDATRPGAASIQTLAGAAAWLYEGAEPQDEDCLFLNVWTPATAGRRPVMVWLHGGAWRTGRGDAVGSDGATLAARGDVVVVTVNYRLGALGWLAHPALRDPDTGTFANWGLQDQILALHWVQNNIAAFGGDPSRVTLFGQSAGGSSTASIAQDPRHHGLLQRAIIESGSLHGAPGFPEVSTAAAYADALAARLSVTVPGLRTVPALTLHRAELDLARDPTMVRSLGRPPVLPVLDGAVLRVWPRDGVLAPVPLLIGSNLSEAVFWYDLLAPDGRRVPGLPAPADHPALLTAIGDLTALYRPEAEAVMPETVANAYAAAARGRNEPDTVLPLWLAIYTDVVFRLRARQCARRHAATGKPVFLYEFAHPLASPAHGVPHTAEIPFAFGTYAHPFFATKLGTSPAEAALSDLMLKAWARFAHEGTPGPGWAAATAETLPTNVLGGPRGILAVEANPRADELAVWGTA